MANIDGNFNFKEFDIGGKGAKVGDGRLTGAEADAARNAGWSIWNDFRENDSHLATRNDGILPGGMGRLMKNFSELHKIYMEKLTKAMEELTGLQGRYAMKEWLVDVVYSDPEMQATLEKAKNMAKEAMRAEGIDISDDAFEFGEQDKEFNDLLERIKIEISDKTSSGTKPSMGLKDNLPAGSTPANNIALLPSVEKTLDYDALETELESMLNSRGIDERKTEFEMKDDGGITIIKYDSEGRKVYEKHIIATYGGTSEFYYDENGNDTFYVSRDSDGKITHVYKDIIDENGNPQSSTLYDSNGNALYTYSRSLGKFLRYDENGGIRCYRVDDLKDDNGLSKSTYYNSNNEPLFYTTSQIIEKDGDTDVETKYYLMNGREITEEDAIELLGEYPF